MGFLTGELKKGRQAYIVCPAIEDGDSDLRSVTAYAEEMRGTLLAGWRIDILHGQMSAQEKDDAMERFR
ncbi:MAG: hypothetical protein IIZ69_14545, partial [Pseudomonas sp.]|nr:hypothetical protein [Pseudomonas sp.]